MMNSNKPIFSLTVEEFIAALREGLGFTDLNVEQEELNGHNMPVRKHYVYGLKGLCSLLGCSISTAARIKKSGAIDAAISQRGKIIVIDSDLALDILNVQHKQRGNRKGYHI